MGGPGSPTGSLRVHNAGREGCWAVPGPPPHLLAPLPPRFLIKSYPNTQKSPGSASKGSLPQSVAYLTAPDLARCPAQTAADFLRPELYTMAWAHVAVR